MTGNDSFPPVPAESARRRLALAVLAAIALVAVTAGVVVGAGHGDGDDSPSGVPSAGRGAPKEHISFLAKIVPPPAESQRGAGAAVPKSVADLARRLPTERKVAQLFLFGFRGTDTSADIFGRLARLDLGGIVLAENNYMDVGQLGALASEAAAIAREKRHVPPWVFASQEGGDLNSFPDLPPTLAPADLNSARRGGRAGPRLGEEPARARDQRGARAGRGRRQLGDRHCARLARVLGRPGRGGHVRGRDRSRYRAEHVFSSAAHFPGHGSHRPVHPGRARDGGTRPGRAPPARSDPVPRRDRRGRARRDDRPRALPVQRLHRAGLAVERGGHGPAAAATALQGRGDDRRPRRPRRSPRWTRCRTPPCRRCAPAPTCSTSRATRATSRPPTSRC